MKTADQKLASAVDRAISEQQSLGRLREWLLTTPNQIVYGLVQAVGTSRRVRLFIVLDGRIQEITGRVKIVNGMRTDSQDRLIVTGTGFNAVSHIVEGLEHVLKHPLRSEYL